LRRAFQRRKAAPPPARRRDGREADDI